MPAEVLPRRGSSPAGAALAVKVVVAGVLIAAGLFDASGPALAGILKTKRKRPTEPNQYRELALVVGSGFEVETDSEQSEYDLPFLLEYGFTETLKLSLEPNYVFLDVKNGRSISGLGDFETTLTYECITERRRRPAVAAEALVKWPTAAHTEFGTGRRDYSIGAIVSKEFVRWDVDFDAVYTLVGNPPGGRLQNTAEVALAVEWHVGRAMDLEAEILSSTGSGGGFHGQPGTIGGLGGSAGASEPNGTETEGTLGLAEHLTNHLKLEEGEVLKSDGSWQAVFAWEWDFGEGN